MPDLCDHLVEGGRHELVHLGGVVAFDEVGLVTIALEEFLQFAMADAGQDGGAGDLVAVEVQDGQDGAVAGGVQELIGVPTGGRDPVSASPSPTTQEAIKSGLSKTAP